MSTYRFAVSVVSVLAILLGGVACSSKPETDAGRWLLRGNGAEPDSLDPQKARSTDAHTILRDICEGLTTLDSAAVPAPGLAESWERSADGLTYTFRLRSSARWSTGEPVVAADVVAGLRRLVDPATASQYAQVVDVIVNAAQIVKGETNPDQLGVSAPDDATVIVRLNAPAPYILGLLAHSSTCAVHRPTLQQHPQQYARPGILPSNGAFTVTEWIQGSHVTAQRNPHYWNKASVKLDGVKYFHIPDENAELTRYRAGDLHTTTVVPRSRYDWIKANIPRELHVGPQLGTYYYAFNLERPPFAGNIALRHALSLVIDREKLTRLILKIGEMPAYGWVPPGTANYTPQTFDYHATPMEQRLIQARQLYAEAGYSLTKPLRFELRYNPGEVNDRLALAVSEMWKQALGVQTQLVAVEFKSLLQDINGGEIEAFRASWVGDYNDAFTFIQQLKSDFGINLPRYRSTEYDQLVNLAAASADPEQRREHLQAAERYLLREHALIPLYFYVNKHLVKPQVQGWYDNVMNVVYSKDLSLR
jgi:oligopeptide transport system substrate-binding protein